MHKVELLNNSVELLNYSDSSVSNYEQCNARFSCAGMLSSTNQRFDCQLALARSFDWYRYEIRDLTTIKTLFGDRKVVNKDALGPIVIIDARPGCRGAIITSFWDLPRRNSDNIYHLCDDVRRAVLAQLYNSPGPALDLIVALTKYGHSWDACPTSPDLITDSDRI
jgi:hypothetical protein